MVMLRFAAFIFSAINQGEVQGSAVGDSIGDSISFLCFRGCFFVNLRIRICNTARSLKKKNPTNFEFKICKKNM